MNQSRGFPFPFSADSYQYNNNLRPLDPPVSIQITDTYRAEIELKRQLLAQHPERCYQSVSDTHAGQWEVLDHLMHELSEVYPHIFTLQTSGQHWVFRNSMLDEESAFIMGDRDTIDYDPLDFIGRHVQEDLILMSQRDNELFLEAGQLCFPGNWSLMFDLGMPFSTIHRPVPRLAEEGIADKIQRFLLRIEAGKPWTRLNWSLNVDRRLDTSPETFDEWGHTRYEVTPDDVGARVQLRVEEQNLIRLPQSQNLLFTIHTHLMPVEEVARNPTWGRRLYHVMRFLPDDITNYKGLTAYRSLLVEYLSRQLIEQETREGDLR